MGQMAVGAMGKIEPGMWQGGVGGPVKGRDS